MKMKRKRSPEKVIKPQPSYGYGYGGPISITISSEERRVLDQSKSLLNLLTQQNFEKIKDEIVQTITSFPSSFFIKSLVCCIFDRAIRVDNAYVLLARLSVELFHALPPFLSDESHITTFEILLLCKCRIFLENDFVDCWRFIKTVRVLADIFKNRMVNETSIAQASELDNRYNEDPLKEAEQVPTLLLQEQKHPEELRLTPRKETECALAIEQEKGKRMKTLKLHQLETLENESEKLREKLEGEYKRICAAQKKRKELEEMKQQLETCKTEQEKLNSQDKFKCKCKCKEELILKKALAREKQALATVKGLREADAMRQERDNALKSVQERQPLQSFICPITQEVMEDPHLTADGYTYEAEAIGQWFSKGHDTSPMTNLNLPHRNLVPNRALRSAIHEFL